MISEIPGLFVNTLTADDKYSIHNSETLWQPIQIRLSKKQQTCAQFLSFFLKSTLIFQHFEKKDDPHSLCIFQITTCERRG